MRLPLRKPCEYPLVCHHREIFLVHPPLAADEHSNMRRHCSSLRKPRWHLQAKRVGCLASRASCLSRHSAAACSPSGVTAASAAHSSKPRYNASHRGSAEHTRRASTQSVGEGGKGKTGAEYGNTPEKKRASTVPRRIMFAVFGTRGGKTGMWDGTWCVLGWSSSTAVRPADRHPACLPLHSPR